MEKEPAGIVGALTGLAAAMVSLLVAFGVDLSDDQQKALLGLVAVLAPILAGVITRRFVWSPASVADLLDDDWDGGEA